MSGINSGEFVDALRGLLGVMLRLVNEYAEDDYRTFRVRWNDVQYTVFDNTNGGYAEDLPLFSAKREGVDDERSRGNCVVRVVCGVAHIQYMSYSDA